MKPHRLNDKGHTARKEANPTPPSLDPKQWDADEQERAPRINCSRDEQVSMKSGRPRRVRVELLDTPI